MLKKLDSLVIQSVLVECAAGLTSLLLYHAGVPFSAIIPVFVVWTLIWLRIDILRMGSIKGE